MNISALRAELTADPLGRNYSAMSDQAAADSLNVANRTASPETIAAAAIWNAIDPAEYAGLSAENKAQVDLISGMGDAVPIQSGLIKSTLFGLFNAQSATRASLIALAAPPISRAQELGLGFVLVGHVTEARA